MGDDIVALLATPLVFLVFGFLIAAALKAVQRRSTLPDWPVALLLGVGLVITIIRLLDAG